MIYYQKSILIRIIFLFSIIIGVASILLLINNPFSQYSYDEPIRVCTDPSLKIVFDSRIVGESYKDVSEKLYTYRNELFYISDTTGYGLTKQVKIVKPLDLGQAQSERSVIFNQLRDCDIHPLPILSTSGKGDLLLLGTTPKGYDFLSILSNSFKGTLKLIILSLFSFLLFGISVGILIGYYKRKFKIIYFFINSIQKIIESVPIILWMIFSISLVKTSLPPIYIDSWAKREIIFILFGIFSSTALSKLLVDKFENLQKEDFIVALKLLGINNFRIITVHIIHYYCWPIIIMQSVYIIAQCIFMDISLSIIEFDNDGSIGYLFSSFFEDKAAYGNSQMIILSIFIYFILSLTFYCSEYYKSKVNTQ